VDGKIYSLFFIKIFDTDNKLITPYYFMRTGISISKGLKKYKKTEKVLFIAKKQKLQLTIGFFWRKYH